VELNRSRVEARCLQRFDVTAEQIGFPCGEQAGRLTRFIDRKTSKELEVETDWVISSRPPEQMTTHQMMAADRLHWGIENGLHLRLDVTAGEDRSRVRNPTSALNLAMIRRATISVGIHWIQHHPRHVSLRDFYDAMAANNCRKAFSLLTVCKASWLPKI
jgi:predicted transposase YbfD/YdcC